MRRFTAAIFLLAIVLATPSANAKVAIPLVRGKCLCIVGLAAHIKPKWTSSCRVVCNSPEHKTEMNPASVG